MQPHPKKLRVLVVGQTPPPYHGQGIMIQMLVDGQYDRMELRHVRMNFSQSLDEIGKIRIGKLLHLISIILQIYLAKLTFRPQVLYYPPAGPNKAPLVRDAAILIATRWLFDRTVFHFQASGCSEFIPTLSNKLKKLVQFALRRPHLAIELSESTVSDGEFLHARRIVHIPNAAYDETDRFPRTPQSMRHEDAPIRILYLGTMCEGKGALVLLEACKRLSELAAERKVNFHVDFVGGFQPLEFRNEIESYIEKHAIQDLVTLHGQLTGDGKWERLAQADLFCFPSHYSSEGFPVVLVEAMAFSLPVVSTYWRGIPDIVEDGVTGNLVQIMDANAIAEALQRLIADSKLRDRYGQQGRAKYLSLYTPVKHRSMMEEAICSTFK